MLKIPCPHCKMLSPVNIPPDAPTAAQVEFICRSCGQSFLYTIGRGIPLFLARVRLWVEDLPELATLILFAGFAWAGYRVYLAGGYPAVLTCLGVMVFFAAFRARQAMKDVNYLLYLVVGTAMATALGAQYLGHVHAFDDVSKLAGLAVLLVLVLAWFGAPAAQWVPPAPSNIQHGGQDKATDQDIDDADL
jgi:hypothetical protein